MLVGDELGSGLETGSNLVDDVFVDRRTRGAKERGVERVCHDLARPISIRGLLCVVVEHRLIGADERAREKKREEALSVCPWTVKTGDSLERPTSNPERVIELDHARRNRPHGSECFPCGLER